MAALTDERLAEFLKLPLVARLAVVTDQGDPYIVPIWFDWDGDGLLIAVREKARFVPWLRKRGRASISIAEDVDQLRRVLITGRVEVVRDAAPDTGIWLERSREVCRRYLGDDAGDEYQDDTISRPCVWFKIYADEMVSWDSPDWHKRYL
jgi:nitroimidazol reductase NimA-like FMN-containing flavoprotein (pyridoxamine 5'-phosphate oxidase superfamily)